MQCATFLLSSTEERKTGLERNSVKDDIIKMFGLTIPLSALNFFKEI